MRKILVIITTLLLCLVAEGKTGYREATDGLYRKEIHIGDTKQQVIKVYGKPAQKGSFNFFEFRDYRIYQIWFYPERCECICFRGNRMCGKENILGKLKVVKGQWKRQGR